MCLSQLFQIEIQFLVNFSHKSSWNVLEVFLASVVQKFEIFFCFVYDSVSKKELFLVALITYILSGYKTAVVVMCPSQ